MEQLLSVLSDRMPVSRFPAVEVADEPSGLSGPEFGCYLSNLGILEQAGDARHTLVLEDDLVFSPEILTGLRLAHSVLERGLVDLLFLGQTVQYDDIALHRGLITRVARLEANEHGPRFELLPAKDFYRWGAFAYLVGRHAIRRLTALVREPMSSGHPMPIDRVYRRLIGDRKIRAGILFPYVVSVNSEMPSTMRGRDFASEHRRHSALVGAYLKDASLADEPDAWRRLLAEHPDLRALAVARQVYERLVERSSREAGQAGEDDWA